jgi:hypothetical protein
MIGRLLGAERAVLGPTGVKIRVQLPTEEEDGACKVA